MKINVHEIPESGLSLKEVYEPALLDIDTGQIKMAAPVNITVEVTRDTENVSVEAAVQGTMRITCGKCLVDTDKVFSKTFHLNYDLSESIIDLLEDLRQEIILDYPIRVLCKEDCKGLCPHCGQNLNEKICGCSKSRKESGVKKVLLFSFVLFTILVINDFGTGQEEPEPQVISKIENISFEELPDSVKINISSDHPTVMVGYSVDNPPLIYIDPLGLVSYKEENIMPVNKGRIKQARFVKARQREGIALGEGEYLLDMIVLELEEPVSYTFGVEGNSAVIEVKNRLETEEAGKEIKKRFTVTTGVGAISAAGKLPAEVTAKGKEVQPLIGETEEEVEDADRMARLAKIRAEREGQLRKKAEQVAKEEEKRAKEEAKKQEQENERLAKEASKRQKEIESAQRKEEAKQAEEAKRQEAEALKQAKADEALRKKEESIKKKAEEQALREEEKARKEAERLKREEEAKAQKEVEQAQKEQEQLRKEEEKKAKEEA
ncbi:MAG: DUF177 domain-containing protein, partial [Candidatus Omnitrophica bacterium]|nr:DUF177 domain-containing protein [Candidatus Omnitrophota bacterium]